MALLILLLRVAVTGVMRRFLTTIVVETVSLFEPIANDFEGELLTDPKAGLIPRGNLDSERLDFMLTFKSMMFNFM
jgi:hypothetical protein